MFFGIVPEDVGDQAVFGALFEDRLSLGVTPGEVDFKEFLSAAKVRRAASRADFRASVADDPDASTSLP